MRFSLDRIVNVVVLIVCAALGVSVALRLADRREQRATAAAMADALAFQTHQIGDQLPPLAEHSYADSEATLVLGVRSTCSFCTLSMPFYRALIDTVRRQRPGVRVVATSDEEEGVLRRYLDTHGVAAAADRTVEPNLMKIAGTPTLLLADSAGRVEHVWIGRLSSDRERDVLAAVANRK